MASPERLSTKVSHAPGGHSSLSLAWQLPQPSSHHAPSHRPSPPPSHPGLVLPSHREEPRPAPQGYQQKKSSLLEENRILEEELQFYQKRNKMLRENIFGGVDNLQNFNQRYNQGRPLSHIHNQYFEPPLWNKVSHEEMLELAIQEQGRQREQQREEQRVRMQTDWGREPQPERERVSIKVNNPPGGRSSIVFG